jgi:hypothetical protein
MKIMLLEVKGGTGDYVIGPYRRIVSVQDETEFLDTIRTLVLHEIIDAIETGKVKDHEQADILRSIKVRLTDTYLSEYPDTPEEQAAMYRKYTQEEVLV